MPLSITRKQFCSTTLDLTLREDMCNRGGDVCGFNGVRGEPDGEGAVLKPLSVCARVASCGRFFNTISLGARQLFLPASSDNSLCGTLWRSFSHRIRGCNESR